jgi:hypothetical protein
VYTYRLTRFNILSLDLKKMKRRKQYLEAERVEHHVAGAGHVEVEHGEAVALQPHDQPQQLPRSPTGQHPQVSVALHHGRLDFSHRGRL